MMPTIELTKSEAKEVLSCLMVELENCEEEVRRPDYQPGERDADCGKSYRKAIRLLTSVIEKLRETANANA
jgi:hypothetical protein